MSDDPIVYVRDGITTYRASSLSLCPRAFIYARQGHPSRVPQNLQVAFDYGKSHESDVISMVEKRFKTSVTYQQAEVVLPVSIDPPLQILGHIDGVIKEQLLEIKCLNHDNTEKFLTNPGLFPGYVTQVSAYAHAWNLRQSLHLTSVLFAIWDKEEEELHTRTLTLPDLTTPDSIQQIILSHELNYSLYQSEDILPTCTTTTYCPYYYLHEDEIINDPDLEAECISLSSIQTRLATLNRLEAIVKGKIKTRLSNGGLTKGRVGGFKFSYSEYETKRLDTKKAGAYLKEVGKYDEFVSKTPATRLVVEEVK